MGEVGCIFLVSLGKGLGFNLPNSVDKNHPLNIIEMAVELAGTGLTVMMIQARALYSEGVGGQLASWIQYGIKSRRGFIKPHARQIQRHRSQRVLPNSESHIQRLLRAEVSGKCLSGGITDERLCVQFIASAPDPIFPSSPCFVTRCLTANGSSRESW